MISKEKGQKLRSCLHVKGFVFRTRGTYKYMKGDSYENSCS